MQQNTNDKRGRFMRTAVMQPYIFPYIGYYQLMNAVDTFVILDDVNFITRGWINRNNILLNNKAYLFSIPLDSPSQNKLICETKMKFSLKDRQKFLKTIQMAYKKATYFDEFYPTLEAIILNNDDDMAGFIHNSFLATFNYLGIEKKILISSKLDKEECLNAEDRIIEICKCVNTDLYINLSGGRSLYHKRVFQEAGMELTFINTSFEQIRYKQYNDEFVESLSFIDILMFNSTADIKNMLDAYTLIEGD